MPTFWIEYCGSSQLFTIGFSATISAEVLRVEHDDVRLFAVHVEAQGQSLGQIAKTFAISRATVSRILKEAVEPGVSKGGQLPCKCKTSFRQLSPPKRIRPVRVTTLGKP